MGKKLLVGLICAGWIAGCALQAGVIDFESASYGNMGQTFAWGGVTFSDTVYTGPLDGIYIDNFGVQGEGTRSLGVFNDSDGSKLQMVFGSSLNHLSLDFGNDDPNYTSPGDLAWLQLYNGATLVATTSVLMNRDDIMNQTISYTGQAFDRALFWYGDATGSPYTQGLNTGLIEIVDNIQFSAVPEPSTYIAGALLLLPFGLRRLQVLRHQ